MLRESSFPWNRGRPSSRSSPSGTLPSCRRERRRGGSPSPRSPGRCAGSTRVPARGRSPSHASGAKSANALLGLRFAFVHGPTAAVPEVADDLAALLQQVQRRVPLPRDVVDDLREETLAVHLRHTGSAFLVRERVEARSGEGAAIQHDEDRREVQVRFREPEVLQLRHVPVDQFPLCRTFDKERQIEPEAIPERYEIPCRFQDALGEDHLDHLLLPPFPLRDYLEQTDRRQIVREGLILDRHDPVLLWIVSCRLDVEVVQRQPQPVTESDQQRSEAYGLPPAP